MIDEEVAGYEEEEEEEEIDLLWRANEEGFLMGDFATLDVKVDERDRDFDGRNE